VQVRTIAIKIVCPAVVALLAGCGAPKPEKFVDGRVTQELHPRAAAAVRQEVVDHFGTPQTYVATMELAEPVEITKGGENKTVPAINFGQITGEVIAAPEGRKLKEHQFAVSLSGGDESITADDLKGLGLVWKTGPYRNAVYEAPKNDSKRGIKEGDELVATFQVQKFTPTKDGQGILSVNYKLESPVEPGVSFVLVGHRLRRGRQLYMQHCMHCHGYSGDGNGPTAKYLNPKPRDYRQGVFKFKSTRGKDRASRSDLKRIVQNGIPGTYMPSFLLLEDGELDDIIEYVRWLSVRGEFEHLLGLQLANQSFTKTGWDQLETDLKDSYQKALQAFQDGERSEAPSAADYTPEKKLQDFRERRFGRTVTSTLNTLQTKWATAQGDKSLVTPKEKRPVPGDPEYRESVANGRRLYLSGETKCAACHGESGRGDGPQTTTYQKSTDPLISGENPAPGLFDEWGNKIQPRDLTSGIYRGGRRPIDLYRRIRIGITGTPMPAFGALTDRQVWDLVNYVLSIPHQENGTFRIPDSGTQQAAKR